MGREEQIEEREVLDSIFPDEITGQSSLFLDVPVLIYILDISETSYRVSIALDVPGQDEDSEPGTCALPILT